MVGPHIIDLDVYNKYSTRVKLLLMTVVEVEISPLHFSLHISIHFDFRLRVISKAQLTMKTFGNFHVHQHICNISDCIFRATVESAVLHFKETKRL